MSSPARSAAALLPCLVLAACGVATEVPDGGPSTIDGVLSVRVGQVLAGADGGTWQPGPPIYVLLGDGTRFLGTPDDQGWVTFRDPSLKGPQTVSVVTLNQNAAVGSDAGVAASWPRIETHLRVEDPELDLTRRLYSGVVGPEPTGRIEVALSNCGDGKVRVQAFGTQPQRSARWIGGCSTRTLYLYGDDPGPFTVVAQNTREDGTTRLPPLQDPRAGMVSGVQLGADGFAHVDLSLEERFETAETVTIQGGAPFSFATLSYWLGNELAFSVSSDGETSPLTLRLPVATSAIGSLRKTLEYGWGETSSEPRGSKSGEPYGGGSIGVAQPAGATILAPRSGPGDDLRFAWSCPAAAHLSFVFSGASWIWDVSGSCSESEFRPFPLPEAIPCERTPGPGDYEAEISASDLPDRPVTGPDLSSWSGNQRISVTLE